MLIDTHCHLDASEFDHDRFVVLQAAHTAGVGSLVVPAVMAAHFAGVVDLSLQAPTCWPALGLHPVYTHLHQTHDLLLLEQYLQTHQGRICAVGEIGLDGFITTSTIPQQEACFIPQLKLAKAYHLPVILHIRKAQDTVLKHLRRIKPIGGIAHAFNGSLQQAHAFIDLGFKLGFGGVMTHPRAQNIRRLAQTLPLESIVLETDAPDLSPHWAIGQRNSPAQLPAIAQTLADLRGITLDEVITKTGQNACAVLHLPSR